MKNRRKIALLVLIGLVVIVVAVRFLALLPREPVYQGRKLSEWLDQYEWSFLAPEAKRVKDEARSAIRRIGTNALPTLLRMASATDSALKRRLLTLAEKQSIVSLRIHRDDDYHTTARCGFSALGPIAKPAVPKLIMLLRHKDSNVRAAAAGALAGIGPEAEIAVPALLQCLDDRNDGTLQIESMLALGAIHRNPELAVPVLTQYLDGSRKDWNYTIFAIQALGFYGGNAKSAIPAITLFVNHLDNNIRSAAIGALGGINSTTIIKASSN